ncbi:MAG: electron transport complex subunit E [Clostridia bacterium]|nr:electron transport complex subunit E [Clostridia bacterium]
MNTKPTFFQQIKDGIFFNNPVFVQFLGMCSILAVTTSVTNAIGMGLSVTAVLVCSNLFISLLRRVIPKQVRIAAYILIISGFVTAVELIVRAYLPDLDKSLGLFIPLIVVNCIILARAESFASKNGPIASVIDGLASGIGYTLGLLVLSFVRELLGTGILFSAADGTGGIQILGDWYPPATIFVMPAGAFLTLGCLCAGFNKLRAAVENRRSKAALMPKEDAQ